MTAKMNFVILLISTATVLFLGLMTEAQQAPQRISVFPGQGVRMICNASQASPSTVYQWEKPMGNVIGQGVTYSISRVEFSHAGVYTCRAFSVLNGVPNQQLISTELTLRANSGIRPNPNPQPPFLGGQGGVTIRSTPEKPLLNQRYTLTCMSDNGMSNGQFEWYVDDQLKARSATFVINNFGKNDFNKKYECRFNANGRLQTKMLTPELRYFTGSQLTMRPSPGIQIMVRSSDRKELHCEIDRSASNRGIRGSSIVWLHNGRELNQNMMRSLSLERTDRIFVSILTLSSIQTQNEGKYECRVEGRSKEAYIIVMESGGSLQVNPSEETADSGQVVEFHCRADNMPNIVNTQLQWFFLGDNPNGPRQPLRREWSTSTPPTARETSFISLNEASLSDQGYYLCVLPNGNSAKGRLTVTGGQASQIRVVVSPRDVRIQPSRPVVVECTATDDRNQPSGTPQWRFADGRPITMDQRYRASSNGVGRSQLFINNLSQRDDNARLECFVGTAMDTVTIRVENFCSANSFRCVTGNQQCIDRSKRCDGQRDCLDGSDEDPRYCSQCDPLEKKCEVYNGRQPVKPTYSASWKCDGEDDCGNGFDESGCQTVGAQCGGTQFRCPNGNLIPRAFMCDNEGDCDQSTDENSCKIPQVIQGPQAINRARQGSTLILTCTASGTPLPKVIWRFNWRCLPDTIRMVESNFNMGCTSVSSTLTISNVRPGDDGIYNCEALTTSGRAISSEAQVILEQ